MRASKRCSEQDVDGLDYLFAIAGVPRLVSEAGAGDPPVPCLLMTQSSSSPAVTLAVAGHVVARRLSGRPSILRHPLIAVPLLPARGSLVCLKSVALPTELPGRNLEHTIQSKLPPRRRPASTDGGQARRCRARQRLYKKYSTMWLPGKGRSRYIRAPREPSGRTSARGAIRPIA